MILFLGCTGIGLGGTFYSLSHMGTLKIMVPFVIATCAIMFPILFMSKGNVFNPAEDTYVDLHMSSVEDIKNQSRITYLGDNNSTQENKTVKNAIHILSKRFYTTYFVYDKLKDEDMFNHGKTEDDDIDKKWDYLLSKYHSKDLYATIDKSLHQNFLNTEAEKFRGTMEQIFAKKYLQFGKDRNAYGSDPFTIYVGSQEYRNKKNHEEVRKDNAPLKRFLFFILSLFTGILGAPVAIGIIDSVMSLFLNGGYFIGSSLDSFVGCLIALVLVITVIVFSIGTDAFDFTNKSVKENHRKENKQLKLGFFDSRKHLEMRTFLAILTTMIISTIFALTTKYDFFTFIAKTIGKVLKYSIFTVFPLGLLIFGALLIYYSYMNYKRFRKEAPST